MSTYSEIETQLVDALQLTRRPVAVSFHAAAPVGVAKFEGEQPSGCSFWQIAAAGDAFYTVPADHFNCPVGSYTHNIALSAERQPELMQVLGLMGEIGYIRMAEVPGIPRIAEPPAAIVYAPLGAAPTAPDAVLVAGQPATLMLLQEAAVRAGVALQPMLGRPTCMAIPAAMGGPLVSSLGCVGNRVYTGLPDDEFYTVIPGAQLSAIAAELTTILTANQALRDYHGERVQTLRH